MSAAVQSEYPELMTLPEVVDYTGLPADTFRLLAVLGIGPAVMQSDVGNVYRTTDLDSWRCNRTAAADLKAAIGKVVDILTEVDEVYAC
jgi:hypothetical protein